MERLTKICKVTEDGKYLPYTIDNYSGLLPESTLGKLVEKLAYYEDLDEQGRLVKYNMRATELLEACVQLLNKQLDSPYVLNLLNELIYYDDCECDGDCLLEDIRYLLEYGE